MATVVARVAVVTVVATVVAGRVVDVVVTATVVLVVVDVLVVVLLVLLVVELEVEVVESTAGSSVTTGVEDVGCSANGAVTMPRAKKLPRTPSGTRPHTGSLRKAAQNLANMRVTPPLRRRSRQPQCASWLSIEPLRSPGCSPPAAGAAYALILGDGSRGVYDGQVRRSPETIRYCHPLAAVRRHLADF